MRSIIVTLGAALLAACGEAGDPCSASIDDGDACTTDACDPATGTVSHTPVSLDDGDACTTDACDPATGVSHQLVAVDDGVACTVDTCDSPEGTLGHTADDAACDDASQCTTEACDAARDCLYSYQDTTATALLAGELPGGVRGFPLTGLPTTVGSPPFTATVCSSGPIEQANPPRCFVVADHGNASLTFEARPDGSYRASGSLPLKIQDVPVSNVGSMTVTGNRGCPPAPQSFLAVPVDVSFRVDAAPGDALNLAVAADPAAVQGGYRLCGSSPAFAAQLESLMIDRAVADLRAYLVAQVEAQLCRPPPCPAEATVVGGRCRYPDGLCVARGLAPRAGTLLVPACAE